MVKIIPATHQHSIVIVSMLSCGYFAQSTSVLTASQSLKSCLNNALYSLEDHHLVVNSKVNV